MTWKEAVKVKDDERRLTHKTVMLRNEEKEKRNIKTIEGIWKFKSRRENALNEI